MTVKVDRSSFLKITFYVTTILTFMFDIDPTEGLRWVKTPSNITKCADETLNLTWEYVKEETEDIRQFQWRFNISTLIAYRSVDNGLHVDQKYHGRVNECGVTGIMLNNITAKDKGSYSFYIIIAWNQNPFMHSMRLNVIDAEAVQIPQWCTCERLPISHEWNGGRNINIVTDGCRLEVNSSHCCIRETVNRCTDKNPQDLCHPFPKQITQIENVTPFRNTNHLTENDTQNGLISEGSKYKDIEVNTVLLIALIIIMLIILVVLIVISICCYWRRKRRLCTKEYQKANIKSAGISEQNEEQRTPMLTDTNDRRLQPCLENQGISEIGEALSLPGGASRFSESAAYNNFEMILRDMQSSQLRILKEMNTLEHTLMIRKWTDSEAHSDYASFGKTWNSSSGPDLTFDIKSARSNPGSFECYHSSSGPDLSSDIKAKHIILSACRKTKESFDCSDSENKGDAQQTNVGFQFDNKPRSRNPIQIYDSMEGTMV